MNEQVYHLILIILSFAGYAIAAVLGWANQKWRIKNLEVGYAALQNIADKQADICRNVEMNNAKLGIIAEATERRLQLLENHMNVQQLKGN